MSCFNQPPPRTWIVCCQVRRKPKEYQEMKNNIIRILFKSLQHRNKDIQTVAKCNHDN